VTNLFKNNYLVRAARYAVVLAVIACGGKKPVVPPPPVPTAPLPTAGISGQSVSVWPLTLVAAEDTLHWDAFLADRRATLDRCDSIIGSLLTARSPEVTWVSPAELRRAARRAVGMMPEPDQMGTAFLRADKLVDVPDPLRYQLRQLGGIAGGRFALVPAGLVFRVAPRPAGPVGAQHAAPLPIVGVAELSVVLVDTRVGKVGWRTVARGEGQDPWTALTRAMKSLTPGLP
jgi:hypothetical protein